MHGPSICYGRRLVGRAFRGGFFIFFSLCCSKRDRGFVTMRRPVVSCTFGIQYDGVALRCPLSWLLRCESSVICVVGFCDRKRLSLHILVSYLLSWMRSRHTGPRVCWTSAGGKNGSVGRRHTHSHARMPSKGKPCISGSGPSIVPVE